MLVFESVINILEKKLIMILKCGDIEHYHKYIAGNDLIWVLKFKGHDTLIWKTKKNILYERAGIPTNQGLTSSISREGIRFVYFSSPIKRAEFIFKKCSGNHHNIWNEGFKIEYKSYHILKRIENRWLENFEI